MAVNRSESLGLVLAGVMVAGACAGPRAPWQRGSDPLRLEAQQRTRRNMQAVIRRYMGVRYRLGGTTRKGVDCSGFNAAVYRAAGVTLPRTAEDQYGEGRSVDQDELQFGDMVFFNTKPGATTPMACLAGRFCPRSDVPFTYGVTHTGVYVGGGRFAHASSSHGVSYARLEDDYWRKRYIGARRILDDQEE